MTKSQSAKLNDATRNKAKYHRMTEAQKKIRNQKSNERRKLRSAKLKFPQIRTAAEALISIKKEADTNSERSKRWRENKKIVNALMTIRNSRALRLKYDSPNYNEEIRIAEVDTPDMGKAVEALTDIPPASKLCAYEGELLTTVRTVQKRLSKGNDKLLQLGDKQQWLDGQFSKTLGPKFNHACDCVANSEMVIVNDKAYMYTKSSAAGNVKKGDQLTVDYGYGKLTKHILKNKNLQWYVQYCKTHKCKNSLESNA